VIIRRHRHYAPEGSDSPIIRRVNLVFTGQSQPNSAVNKECSQQVEDPMESLDQSDSSDDKNTAHYQCAQNSPEQHAVLVFVRYREVPEDHEEDKKIVDTEREFHQISGGELDGYLPSLPEKHPAGKSNGKCEPDSTANQRIAGRGDSTAAGDIEVQHQNADREDVEEYPGIKQSASMLNQN